MKNGANTNTARGKEKNWPNSKLKLKWRLHYHKIIINIIGTNKSHKKFGRTKTIKKKKKKLGELDFTKIPILPTLERKRTISQTH